VVVSTTTTNRGGGEHDDDDAGIDPQCYPEARRDPTAVDEVHGEPNPYGWMEDSDAEETRRFVDQLNALSRPFIDASPLKQRIGERFFCPITILRLISKGSF
jgi:hypothetical protein